MAAIFDSIFTGLCVLPDPENMVMAVGISLLSCIEAELYVLSFLLPVNGRHLSDISRRRTEFPSVSPCSSDPKNMGIAVVIMHFRYMAAMFDFSLSVTG